MSPGPRGQDRLCLLPSALIGALWSPAGPNPAPLWFYSGHSGRLWGSDTQLEQCPGLWCHGLGTSSPSIHPSVPHNACMVPVPLLHWVPYLGLVLAGGEGTLHERSPHLVTTDAFTLTDGAFPHVGIVLEAQLWGSPEHGPGGALTLRTSVWVHTGTPEGQPAAPRLSLKGSSTPDTCSSFLVLSGACRGCKRTPCQTCCTELGNYLCFSLVLPLTALHAQPSPSLPGPWVAALGAVLWHSKREHCTTQSHIPGSLGSWAARTTPW